MNKELSIDNFGFATCAQTATVFALGVLMAANSAAAQIDASIMVEAQTIRASDRPHVVTQRTGGILLEAQERMEDEEYDRAIVVIDGYLERELKSFDLAKVLELRGYAEAGRDDYEQAALDWEAALVTGALPDYTVQDMYYRLAQVYAALEQYPRALLNMEKWFAWAGNPGAEALFFAARLYYVSDRPKKAQNCVERGLAKKVELRQSWFEVAIAIYYENGSYEKAVPLIEQAIKLWPSKGYERFLPTDELREIESDFPLNIMRARKLSGN